MLPALKAALAERFAAVNGRHVMTEADDRYVSEWFATAEDVSRTEGLEIDDLARLMLAGALPLPSYIRSDGAFMVPRDLMALAGRAGGIEHLPQWFGQQFDDPADALTAWQGYLNGHWVCLREVTPEAMQRKEALAGAIARSLEGERDEGWRERLTQLVDELDQLEPPFAPYDRLRFGGPVSRDRLITGVRDTLLSASPT